MSEILDLNDYKTKKYIEKEINIMKYLSHEEFVDRLTNCLNYLFDLND